MPPSSRKSPAPGNLGSRNWSAFCFATTSCCTAGGSGGAGAGGRDGADTGAIAGGIQHAGGSGGAGAGMGAVEGGIQHAGGSGADRDADGIQHAGGSRPSAMASLKGLQWLAHKVWQAI